MQAHTLLPFLSLYLLLTSLADGQKIACDSNTPNPTMSGNRERSFIMLKPDAVHRGLVGEIVKRFEAKGFKLVAMKMMHVSVLLDSKKPYKSLFS